MTVSAARTRTRSGSRRRFDRRLAALLASASLLLSASPPAATAAGTAATNHAPTAPTGLRTELLSDAVVVGTTDPSLSWVVNDEDPDEVQTAYRVVIATTRADVAAEQYVLDTGWQDSARSSSVEVPGISDALQADSLYYWQVQTKDRSGAESPLSAPEAFNTPVEWADTHGAWLEYSQDETPSDANRYFSVPTNQSSPGSLLSLAEGSGTGTEASPVPGSLAPASASEWTNYSVEARIYTTSALGVIFRRSGAEDYMWQFRSSGISTNPDQVCAHTGTTYVELSCSPATIPSGTWVPITITAINDVVTTYVNHTLVDTRRVTHASAGTIGFRTGRTESARVDDIVVRSISTGRTLYAEDFSTASGSAGYTGGVSVTDGYLTVPVAQLDGAVLTLADDAGPGLAAHPEHVAPAAADQWADYAIDADVSTASALGVVFRDDGTNNFMWQLKPSNNTLNYHAGRDYAGEAPPNPTSPTLPAGTLTPNAWFHLRIEAQGSTVRTFVDGALVGTVTDTNATAGTIGLRTGSTESARVDNLVVQSLTTGRYLYAEDAQTLALGQSADFPGVSVTTEQSSSLVFPSFMFLRHAFDLEGTSAIDRAVVTATGSNTQSSLSSMADLFVNGQALGTYPARNHAGAPAGSLQYYSSYDVTDLLHDGENVIASLAYNRDATRGVLLQLTVWRSDGTRQVVTNSARDAAQWHAYDGTPVFGDVLQSRNNAAYDQHAENLVAARYPFGFDQTGYTEDASWRPVRVAGAVNGTRVLTPFTAETTERHEMPAASVTDLGDGTYVVALEKEIVGSLELAIDSPATQAITVKYAETLNGDGSVRLGGVGSGSYPKYQETWTLKEGQQSLRTYLMKNFRYVQIENSPVPITTDMVHGWAIRTAFDEDASSFSSSDPLLDRLYEYTKYSVEATNQDVWVDSQARERLPYEGDLLVNLDASDAVSADYALGRHSAEYLIDNPTWPAEYKLFSVEAAWADYLHTGDADTLTTYYAKIKAKLDPSTDTSASGTFVPEVGLVRTLGTTTSGNRVLVDWPTGEQDGYVFPDPGYSAPYNAIYAGAAEAMARIAGVVGNAEDEALWQDRADTIKENLIAKLYDPDKGAFADSMRDDGTVATHFAQHSTAYALAYGIYDSPEMAARLVAFLDGQGGFKGSIYAAYFVLRGLFRADGGDVGLRFLLNPDSTDRRTFAHVLDGLGATISAEAWDPSLKGNMTMSHPWGASPGAAIVDGMFGIKPTKPGYEELAVTFQPGDVGSAAITVPTLRGAVGASFDNTTTLFSSTVDIPVNTSATVSVPAANRGFVNLEVDGQVVTATRSGSFLTVQVGSGHHTVALSAEGATFYQVTLAPSADTVVAAGTVTTTLGVTDETGAPADLTGAAVVYQSSDESVATVDASGMVTGVSEGDVTIRVTVTNGDRTGFASAQIHVRPAPRITRLEVRATFAAVGDVDTPELVGIAEDGSEVAFTDATFESSDPAVAQVRQDGSVRVLAPGAFTLTAQTTQHFEDLAPDFDFSAFRITPLWSDDFDDGVNPFTSGPANPSVVGGRLYVDKSKNSMLPIGADWTDYVVTFTAEAVAGTSTNALGEGLPLLLRARTNTPPGENYYWQVFSSNMLKRGAGIAETDPVAISNVQPAGTANRIAIAAEGDRFMTYVNGRLVDTWTSDTYGQGTIGVRTGSSDARFYLDDLVVGTRTLTAGGTFSVAADTTRLETLIDASEGLVDVLDGFTDASANTFRDALATARTVAEDKDHRTQAEVDQAMAALQAAMSGLELKPVTTPTPSSTVLRALRDQVEPMTNADGRYTATSWATLRAAVTDAGQVLDDAGATQDRIDTATTNLGAALVGLRLATSGTDRLETLVDAAQGLVGILDGFTDASANALRDALATARTVLDESDHRPQADVDQALAALQAAMSGLEPRPSTAPTPDPSVLRALHDRVAPMTNAEGRYTAASWTRLRAAVTVAEQVLDDADPTQDRIDAAATGLGAALAGLELTRPPAQPPVEVPRADLVTKVKLSQKQLRLVKGKTFRLTAGVYHGDGRAAATGKVTWKSSKPTIAKVTKAGKVKARKKGKVTITATTTERSAAGKRLSATITVRVVKRKPKARIVKVRAAVPSTMRPGQVVYVTGRYASAKATGVRVRYKTSDPRVVAVDKAGRLVARQAGTASVTVRARGKKAHYRVTVR